MPKMSSWLISACVLLFFGLVFFLNSILSRSIPKEKTEVPPPVQQIAKPSIVKKDYSGKKITERKHLDANSAYYESVFWVDDVEVGKFKSQGDKVYDVEGDIPDGKVEFVDETADTYGEAHYKRGKKHGQYVEYYKNGAKRRESEYVYGRVALNKEYFIDGKLRLEEDLQDVLFTSESKDSGVGRTYYRDGTLMYEWNITNKGPQRYTKAYNIKGELVEVKYYDSHGRMLRVENPKSLNSNVLESQP